MQRQEISGSEVSKLKLKGHPQRPDSPQTTYAKQHVLGKSGLTGSCGPGSVEPDLAWPAASNTTAHRPGGGWAEEEWQKAREQLGKGRILKEGDAAGWLDNCGVLLPALPEEAHWLNATRPKNHLLSPGACKFLHSTSAQVAAKQVADVMTALQA